MKISLALVGMVVLAGVGTIAVEQLTPMRLDGSSEERLQESLRRLPPEERRRVEVRLNELTTQALPGDTPNYVDGESFKAMRRKVANGRTVGEL